MRCPCCRSAFSITRASANLSDNARGQSGRLREQVFDHARVAPAEQAVEVAKLFVEIVIALGADQHDVRSAIPGVCRIIFASARIFASEPIRLLS